MRFLFLLTLLFPLLMGTALGQTTYDGNGTMHKCRDNQGRVTYTNTRCAAGQRQDENFLPPKPKAEPDAADIPLVGAPPVEPEPPKPQPQPVQAPTPQPVQVIQAPPVVQEPERVYVPVGGWAPHPPRRPAHWSDPRWGSRPRHWPGPPYRRGPRPRPTPMGQTHLTGPKAGSWQYNNQENSLYRRR